MSTLAGNTSLAGSGRGGYLDGPGPEAQFFGPANIAVDASGSVYVAEQNNSRIRKVTAAGVVTTIAGTGTNGHADGDGTSASFYDPADVVVDAAGTLYVADFNNALIRKITPSGAVTSLAGKTRNIGFADGSGNTAQFQYPAGVGIDPSGGTIFVADYGNQRVRSVSPDGTVKTLAGTGATGKADGPGSAATFAFPHDVAVDGAGNVYVADTNNSLIRKVTSAGDVTTLAGSGATGSVDAIGVAASFNRPTAIAVDATGDIYIADSGNNLVRKVTAGGRVTTLAGSGKSGYADGIGRAAQFRSPSGIAVGLDGTVYVFDAGNSLLRKIKQ